MQRSPSLNQLNRFSYSSFLAPIFLLPALLQARLDPAIRFRISPLFLPPLEAYHDNLSLEQTERDPTVDIRSDFAELHKAIDFWVVDGNLVLVERAVLSEEGGEINTFLEHSYLNIQKQRLMSLFFLENKSPHLLCVLLCCFAFAAALWGLLHSHSKKLYILLKIHLLIDVEHAVPPTTPYLFVLPIKKQRKMEGLRCSDPVQQPETAPLCLQTINCWFGLSSTGQWQKFQRFLWISLLMEVKFCYKFPCYMPTFKILKILKPLRVTVWIHRSLGSLNLVILLFLLMSSANRPHFSKWGSDFDAVILAMSTVFAHFAHFLQRDLRQ